MYKPAVEIPEHCDRICRQPVAINFGKKEQETYSLSAMGVQVPKMRFWERLKYLFTGNIPASKKRGPIDPPPFDLKELKRSSPEQCTVSYSTFAGCDVKFHLVFGIGEDPAYDELVQAIAFEHAARHSKGLAAGYVKMRTVWAKTNKSDAQRVVKTVGNLRFPLFDSSIMNMTEKLEGPVHFVAQAVNEYGDCSFFALKNFKITSWGWGISVDDLISEELMDFEADEPIYWRWAPRPKEVSDVN